MLLLVRLDNDYNFNFITQRCVIACPKVSPKYALEELHHNLKLCQRPIVGCLNNVMMILKIFYWEILKIP